jgi:hypothetical protein
MHERRLALRYEKENETKACFDDVYTSQTPHAYIQMMAKCGYEIGEQARPYCIAAAKLLDKHNKDKRPVHMLDIGCSYGIGSALLKYGCSFDEMVSFFSTRAPQDLQGACKATRAWLDVRPTVDNISCVGLDSSEPAVRFAMMTGLLDFGIARNFENPVITCNQEERSWLRNCNLLISTGSIGYVTDRTMNQVLRHVGKHHPNEFGPIAVLTILRMFESRSIRDSFENHGFRFEKVPGIMLSQRRFMDQNERKGILKILHDKNIDTSEWEDRGKMLAELFIAAKPEHFPELLEKINETHSKWVDDESNHTTYICR